MTPPRSLLSSLLVLALPVLVLAEDWPGFRGPTGQGISAEKNLPTRWSATENIAWKTDLPGEGWSSPVVFKDRVFVTATTDEGTSCHVVCLDAGTGKILWDSEAFRQEPGRKEKKNSHATPTPVVDADRVYTVFSSGGIAALDHAGKIAWVNRDTQFSSKHGLGASPIRHGDLFIMPFDGSSSGADREVGWKKPWDQAYITALDRATGKEKWRGRRGLSRVAHVTPTVLSVAGSEQIISGAGDVVQGFDPKTGERLWSVPSQGEGVSPSPVCGEGLVFSISGFEKPTLRAVKPGDGRKKAEIVWEHTKAVPLIPSLVYVKPHLFGVTEKGIGLCLEAATGKEVWQERIGGPHSASPVCADGKVYYLAEDGTTTVIEASATFRVLERNPLGEHCQASMAVSGGKLFIRTEKRLFCIGK